MDLDSTLDYYTPTLITSNSMLKQDPETVRAFLRATACGYRFAVDNPKAAADILLRYTDNLDPEFVRKSPRYLSGNYIADAERWGVMEKSRWSDFSAFLYDHGLLERRLDAEAAFTNEYLPEE